VLPPSRPRQLLEHARLRQRARRLVRTLPPSPISPHWGFDRGTPVDRVYIEAFLEANRADIRGAVLEFMDDGYTRRFGGDRVTTSDVLEVVEGNPKATIVADLTRPDELPAARFDCIICTQVLQMIFDVRTAAAQLCRLLNPGGVLLVTGSGVSKVGRRLGVDPWGEYWRFTAQSLTMLLEEAFAGGAVAVEPYGNVFAATAFLYGLAAEELPPQRLAERDPAFELLLAGRAQRTAS
jgi:SAM-dependent methyltransferase